MYAATRLCIGGLAFIRGQSLIEEICWQCWYGINFLDLHCFFKFLKTFCDLYCVSFLVWSFFRSSTAMRCMLQRGRLWDRERASSCPNSGTRTSSKYFLKAMPKIFHVSGDSQNNFGLVGRGKAFLPPKNLVLGHSCIQMQGIKRTRSLPALNTFVLSNKHVRLQR